MKEKNIILAARILSMVFTPFYLSLVGLIALFTFSYLSLMPWPYKIAVPSGVRLLHCCQVRHDRTELFHRFC